MSNDRIERARLIGTPELKVRLCCISVQLLSAVLAITTLCVILLFPLIQGETFYLGNGC